MVSPYEAYVLAIQQDPEKQEYVRKHYLDADLSVAVSRYAQSTEFDEISGVLRAGMPPQGRLLDFGIGRGLTYLSFQQKGFLVTGLEYDGSDVSGVGALAK